MRGSEGVTISKLPVMYTNKVIMDFWRVPKLGTLVPKSTYMLQAKPRRRMTIMAVKFMMPCPAAPRVPASGVILGSKGLFPMYFSTLTQIKKEFKDASVMKNSYFCARSSNCIKIYQSSKRNRAESFSGGMLYL